MNNAPGLNIIFPDGLVFCNINGETWVYIPKKPRIDLRYPIQVEFNKGYSTVLIGGPPTGSHVVSAGGCALLGIELGIEAEKQNPCIPSI